MPRHLVTPDRHTQRVQDEREEKEMQMCIKEISDWLCEVIPAGNNNNSPNDHAAEMRRYAELFMRLGLHSIEAVRKWMKPDHLYTWKEFKIIKPMHKEELIKQLLDDYE